VLKTELVSAEGGIENTFLMHVAVLPNSPSLRPYAVAEMPLK
jgi:hypothetical protein